MKKSILILLFLVSFQEIMGQEGFSGYKTIELPSGERVQCLFVNGEKYTGEEIEEKYNPETGVIGRKINYKEGLRHGLTREYGSNGQILASVLYQNGKKNGLATFYYPNGNKREEIYFKNGIEHGEGKNFYEDGTLQATIHYENGKKQGKGIVYYPNGNKQMEMFFEKDTLVGEIKYYDKKGNIIKANE